MVKHPKKFCNIQRWLEKEHPELADVVRDLCSIGQLSGRQGATFLCPDEATRKAIIKIAYSADPEGAVIALQAHAIPAFAADAAALKQLSDEGALGTRAGSRLTVDSVDKNKVTITSGDGKHSAVISPDPSFVPLNRDLSVWRVESGSLSHEDEGFKPKSRRAVKGGGAGINRAQIAAALQSQMQQHLGGVGPNPYTAAVCALLDCAGPAAQAIGPLLDYNPITSFYLLLEPGNSGGACCLSDACVGEFQAKLAAGLPPCTYAQYVEKMRAACGGRCQGAMSYFVNAQHELSTAITNPFKRRKQVCDLYQKLAPELLRALNIPPEMVSAEKKLWQDEVRFSVAAMLATGRALNQESYTEVIEFMNLHPGNDLAKECGITGSITGENLHVSPIGEALCLNAFISSTALMYSAWDDSGTQDMTVSLGEAAPGKIFSLQRIASMLFGGR